MSLIDENNAGADPEGGAEAYERARAAITGSAADWTALLGDLIRIPSRFESEHEIVEFVCGYVRDLGLTPVLVPMDAAALRRDPDASEPISEVSGRNNVVVRVPGTGGGRSLILNSHLDIQPEGDPAEWTHPPFSAFVDAEKNVMFGRGAMDDKAGVTICLGLLRVQVETGLRFEGDLVFQFVLEDEITGNGSLVCLEAGYGGEAAIILDGTRPDRAIDQHAGNMEFTVALAGKPASVSVSHMGVNAAELLSRLLLHLRDGFFALNETRSEPWTQFPSPFQFVIHAVQSDAPRFSVPVEASARCFVTFPPPATLDGMRGFLEREAREFADSQGYPHPPVFDWRGFAAEPVCSATDELRATLLRAAERNELGELRVGPSTGTSDMRHFAKRGIPCLLYGPGRGYNPHRADEYFLLDDLPAMMSVFLDLMAAWCNR